MTDWQIIQLARIRKQELDREIESIRLAKLSRSNRIDAGRKRNATLYAVGKIFVSWGSFLKDRYGANTIGSESCR